MVLVCQSHKIALQYMCILHFVVQSGGPSQIKCLSKTDTDKNIAGLSALYTVQATCCTLKHELFHSFRLQTCPALS